MNEDYQTPRDLLFAEDFAWCSFAFTAVSGFCIGGSALANIVGIPYINKLLSLKNCVY